jgi:hypothetical protein
MKYGAVQNPGNRGQVNYSPWKIVYSLRVLLYTVFLLFFAVFAYFWLF